MELELQAVVSHLTTRNGVPISKCVSSVFKYSLSLNNIHVQWLQSRQAYKRLRRHKCELAWWLWGWKHLLLKPGILTSIPGPTLEKPDSQKLSSLLYMRPWYMCTQTHIRTHTHMLTKIIVSIVIITIVITVMIILKVKNITVDVSSSICWVPMTMDFFILNSSI